MELFAGHAESWVGTNGFRLMPDDPLHTAAATALVTIAAGGNVATIAYTWVHPSDGAQDGLLVVGADADAVVALWGDSWHQSPAPQVLHGEMTDGIIRLSYVYAGDWEWRIAIDARDVNQLRLEMDNVVPESDAYPVMVMELRRA